MCGRGCWEGAGYVAAVVVWMGMEVETEIDRGAGMEGWVDGACLLAWGGTRGAEMSVYIVLYCMNGWTYGPDFDIIGPWASGLEWVDLRFIGICGVAGGALFYLLLSSLSHLR